jgi:hypothetical protein
MKKLVMSTLLAVGILGLSFGQNSQTMDKDKDKDWVKIGETTLNLSQDYGIFDWDRDREETVNANDRYTAIKFKTKDAAKVALTEVEVKYDDGKMENLKVNAPIDVNTESKTLQLDSNKELDEITFRFQKNEMAREEKVKVEIWGLKHGATSDRR